MGPMMVPMLQTKGMMEKARAGFVSREHDRRRDRKHTFMFGLSHQLANHGLDDADVAVQQTAKGAPGQREPEVLGEPHHDHAEHGADAADQQDWLAADAVG